MYKNKNILIDTGFRGKPVKVLDCNGFEYSEKKLEFHKEALRTHGPSPIHRRTFGGVLGEK